MEQLLNFCQLTENIGTAGQPTKAQLRTIADLGYANVVNLALHDSDNAIKDEGNFVAAMGMSYFHLPVPFDKPTAEHVKKFIGLMNLLNDEKVFVHCAVNARVSAFMYKYLTLERGMTAEMSTTPLLKQWLPQMDDAWTSIMNLNAQNLQI
jgi:protein tyrosine phosphatase (PTP) superfamily phosphohydrolase (DUF442 family)